MPIPCSACVRVAGGISGAVRVGGGAACGAGLESFLGGGAFTLVLQLADRVRGKLCRRQGGRGGGRPPSDSNGQLGVRWPISGKPAKPQAFYDELLARPDEEYVSDEPARFAADAAARADESNSASTQALAIGDASRCSCRSNGRSVRGYAGFGVGPDAQRKKTE